MREILLEGKRAKVGGEQRRKEEELEGCGVKTGHLEP